jgi:hypothetical protein
LGLPVLPAGKSHRADEYDDGLSARQPEKRAFVPVVGDGFMLRYNSKLPLVIYAPGRRSALPHLVGFGQGRYRHRGMT